jgi:integrase
MMALFDVISDDPLEICVKLAAYYGLRRSEVLGLKWDAVNLEQKTISIKHKVIEDTIDGKSIAVGEDVLKTKSSFRTLPLLPSVEKLLLAEKEKQEMYRIVVFIVINLFITICRKAGHQCYGKYQHT